MVLPQKVLDNLLTNDRFDLETIIPDNLEKADLLDCKNQLDRLLAEVTHDISNLILKHQPSYVSELKRISDLNKSIIDCMKTCSRGRQSLKFMKDCPNLLRLLDRREVLVDMASKIFTSFHCSSMEELKMFLANESWEMLPVKSDFNVMQLKEFAFLSEGSDQNNYTSSEDLFEADDHRQKVEQTYALPLDRISLSSDSDVGKDYVDEDEVTNDYRLTKSAGPVLTNSSLNVLRLAGRYIRVMKVLNPISFEVLMNIYKLLDQYIIFVFKKFGPDDDKKLEDVIGSLRESLVSDQSSIDHVSDMLSSQVKASSSEPQVQSNTHQEHPPHKIDPKKAIAIESLIFLVNQLWNLHEYLLTLISPEQQAQLREQFSQRNSSIPDFLKARSELYFLPPRPSW